jgi:hypothetical protein
MQFIFLASLPLLAHSTPIKLPVAATLLALTSTNALLTPTTHLSPSTVLSTHRKIHGMPYTEIFLGDTLNTIGDDIVWREKDDGEPEVTDTHLSQMTRLKTWYAKYAPLLKLSIVLKGGVKGELVDFYLRGVTVESFSWVEDVSRGDVARIMKREMECLNELEDILSAGGSVWKVMVSAEQIIEIKAAV